MDKHKHLADLDTPGRDGFERKVYETNDSFLQRGLTIDGIGPLVLTTNPSGLARSASLSHAYVCNELKLQANRIMYVSAMTLNCELIT